MKITTNVKSYKLVKVNGSTTTLTASQTHDSAPPDAIWMYVLQYITPGDAVYVALPVAASPTCCAACAWALDSGRAFQELC